jgi:hypothetical protein
MIAPTARSLPFPRSYWATPGKLVAGCYPSDRDPAVARTIAEGLAACGVTHVINLMHADERDSGGRAFIDYAALLDGALATQGRRAVCARHPIVDVSVPSVLEMGEILEAIDAIIGAGGIVYVHCWGGRGRTGTVVGCHLARHGIATGQGALDRLVEFTRHWKREWGPTPETEEQRGFVRAWRKGQ